MEKCKSNRNTQPTLFYIFQFFSSPFSDYPHIFFVPRKSINPIHPHPMPPPLCSDPVPPFAIHSHNFNGHLVTWCACLLTFISFQYRGIKRVEGVNTNMQIVPGTMKRGVVGVGYELLQSARVCGGGGEGGLYDRRE